MEVKTILALSFITVYINITAALELVVKNPHANAGDAGSIPGSGSSPGKGNGNPLQHSCLENFMDREAWQSTAHGVAKSQTRLRDEHFHKLY